MKHLRDIDGAVHCEGADGVDCTLCGLALEGERGDTPMAEVHKGIDCERCITTIYFCKRIRNGEIKALFRRRALT